MCMSVLLRKMSISMCVYMNASVCVIERERKKEIKTPACFAGVRVFECMNVCCVCQCVCASECVRRRESEIERVERERNK